MGQTTIFPIVSPLPTLLSRLQPNSLPILLANRILRIQCQRDLLPNPWEKQANGRKKVCCCTCRIAVGCAVPHWCDGFVVKFERPLPEKRGRGCYQQAVARMRPLRRQMMYAPRHSKAHQHQQRRGAFSTCLQVLASTGRCERTLALGAPVVEERQSWQRH